MNANGYCGNLLWQRGLTLVPPEAFRLAAVPHPTARAIDWDETRTPRRWQTFDGVKEFDWGLTV